ncbi:hypothetical protein Tco_0266895 [Tanacetum coccineum]
MLEIMVELQDTHTMFKKKLLRVAMFRKRQGMYKEIFKLLPLEMLQIKEGCPGVILSNEQNDFLLVDAAQMEELEKLSVDICMIARIKQENIDSDEGHNYDFAFISEVQTPSTNYMNPLFTVNNHEQTYHKQPKIIYSTICDDQINSDIIFDDLNMEVNNGSVEHDKYVHDSYKLEQLARIAYKEAEKQQIIANKVKQQNVELTKQVEQYNKIVQVFETNKATKTNLQTKFIEPDRKVKLSDLDLEEDALVVAVTAFENHLEERQSVDTTSGIGMTPSIVKGDGITMTCDTVIMTDKEKPLEDSTG